MMSESHDIEQIARAIYESRNGAGAKPWSLRPKAHKAPYFDDARAILPLIRAAEAKGAENMRERAAVSADSLSEEEFDDGWIIARSIRALPPTKEG